MKLNQIALVSGLVVSGIAVSGVFAPAKALSLTFTDNFNGENGGVGELNYNSFNNWTVTDGTVDLIGNGFFDFYPGNGLYVDLDGSSFKAGVLTTKTAFNLSPGDYILQFDLGGSQRGDTNIVDVALGSVFSKEYIRESSDPLALVTENIHVSSSTSAFLSFHNLGGDDVGAILDNVSLTSSETTSVPEPLNILGSIAGLALFGTTSAALKRKAK